jgi:hypothetical protein
LTKRDLSRSSNHIPSTFTWLDYSEAERRKMNEIIGMFREKETRDELGIGSIRDAFADTFFPGTSTIQTRARYFLFIPWMYRQLEVEGIKATQIAKIAKRRELDLIYGLIAGSDKDGVIGARAQEKLQRLPSSVYWVGLSTWGIRLCSGSQDQYHRSLDRFYMATHNRRSARTIEDDPLDDHVSPNWHPQLPPMPTGFPERVTFALQPAEAEYLAERIKVKVPRSLLAFLVDADYTETAVAFAWDHPALPEFSIAHREQLEHARNFSEAIHGSALLYNLMLAELVKNEELIETYRSMLQRWAAILVAQQPSLSHWDMQRFWEIVSTSGANVTPQTRRFVDRWLALARMPELAATVADNQPIRDLVHERERQLKRKLARLDNPRARELWSGGAGIGQLDYRWFRAQRMIADIQAARVPRGTYA